MTFHQFLDYCRLHFGSIKTRTVYQLMAGHLDVNEAAIIAWPDRLIPAEVQARLIADLHDLAGGRPLAYVFGTIPFLDHTFRIDERALIPRPETEALCDQIIATYRVLPPPRKIIDLCCGSGVLGISLALAFPQTHVTMTDLSAEALALTRENVTAAGLDERIELVEGDLWEPVKTTGFDLVVVNPPYVSEHDEVGQTVLDHEPHMALFSGEAGTGHVKRILKGLETFLAIDGRAAFELGHEHRQLLSDWIMEHFPDWSFRWEDDPFGVPRFLFIDQLHGRP